jgi:FkbM family methyltransferase
MLRAAQRASIATFRAMPYFRGRGTAARIVNRYLLKLGAEPLICVPMTAGHKLWLDARVQSMARAIYEGEYDGANMAALARLMRPGGTVLDVGAQVGLWTVPLACHARKVGARVVAFEPVPQNFDFLGRNVGLNELRDIVTLHNVALGDREGETEIALGWDFDDGGVIGNAVIMEDAPAFAESQRHITVRRARFDDLWDGARIDAIKLDVEGRETEFLAGAQRMIVRDQPAIMMEICRGFYRDRGLDLEALLPASLPASYRVHRVTNAGIEACALRAIPELTDALLLPAHLTIS